jgi:hypothetical protein
MVDGEKTAMTRGRGTGARILCVAAVVPLMLAAVALPWSWYADEQDLVFSIGFACTAAIFGGYSVSWPSIRNSLAGPRTRLAVFSLSFLPALLLPLLLGLLLGQSAFVLLIVTYLAPLIVAGARNTCSMRPSILVAGLSIAVLSLPIAFTDIFFSIKDGESGIDELLLGVPTRPA